MEFNLNIRIVVEGKDSDKLTEENVIDFVKSELGTGSFSYDNPLIDEGKECEISYVELD